MAEVAPGALGWPTVVDCAVCGAPPEVHHHRMSDGWVAWRDEYVGGSYVRVCPGYQPGPVRQVLPRTVLATRLELIRQLHPAAGDCNTCLRAAPCTTRQLADGAPTQPEPTGAPSRTDT